MINPATLVVVIHPSGAVRKMDEIEAEVIRDVCEHCGWNMRKVVQSLGIGRSTLYRKLMRYGIKIERVRRDG